MTGAIAIPHGSAAWALGLAAAAAVVLVWWGLENALGGLLLRPVDGAATAVAR